MLIDGNEPDVDDDGTLMVGADAGAAVGAAAGAAAGAAPPKGEGGGGAAAGGATCAPAFSEAARKAMPATAPLRARLVTEANLGEVRIIAGDP